MTPTPTPTPIAAPFGEALSASTEVPLLESPIGQATCQQIESFVLAGETLALQIDRVAQVITFTAALLIDLNTLAFAASQQVAVTEDGAPATEAEPS